jgi:hypothetical protein
VKSCKAEFKTEVKASIVKTENRLDSIRSIRSNKGRNSLIGFGDGTNIRVYKNITGVIHKPVFNMRITQPHRRIIIITQETKDNVQDKNNKVTLLL